MLSFFWTSEFFTTHVLAGPWSLIWLIWASFWASVFSLTLSMRWSSHLEESSDLSSPHLLAANSNFLTLLTELFLIYSPFARISLISIWSAAPVKQPVCHSALKLYRICLHIAEITQTVTVIAQRSIRTVFSSLSLRAHQRTNSHICINVCVNVFTDRHFAFCPCA